MAHQTKPRLGESSTTTGTGPFTLDGALTAHKRFSAECSVADTFWGNIAAVDGSGNETGDWVEGLMTYSAANEVTVTTVYKSSNADAAVTFGAGTKYVTLIADARQIAAAPRGGSAGQALTKINGTDYNTQWSTVATDAASVTNTPAGNIAATDVQAALNELDTEKQAAMTSASQAEMEAGTEAALRAMSPLRVAQAIDALAAGGAPGGSDTQVQFNDGGAFGGDAGLTFDKTTNLLTVGGRINIPSGDAYGIYGGDPSGGGVGLRLSTDRAFFTVVGGVVCVFFPDSVDFEPGKYLRFYNPGYSAPVALGAVDANVLEVNNMTPGTLRDMRLRNVVGQAGYTEMVEMTAPAAPAANTVRLYCEDSGAGKTRLMALFPTGAAQQVAIEP